MSFFNKKEEIPRIPPAPVAPEFTVQENNFELPTLPSNIGQKFNQEIVKSAVNDSGLGLPPLPETEIVQELPREFKFEKSAPQRKEMPSLPSKDSEEQEMIPSISSEKIKPIIKDGKAKTDLEPIFVRIDKFQAAKKDLIEINKKVKSVETLLNKLEEIKDKEDSEIDQLAKDLEILKTRLASVDSNVFQKA